VKIALDDSDNNVSEVSDSHQFQRWNTTTNGGVMQVKKEMDELTQKHKKFADMIEEDQQALKNTNKEITDITNQAEGKSGIDILKLKALSLQMQNEQQLLVAHGQELMAINDQINKNRQLFAEQRDLVNINTDASMQALQQHSSSDNDLSDKLFDKVDEAHQKAEDQQEMVQQRIADEEQRIQDKQDR
jgi:hypothetical protein